MGMFTQVAKIIKVSGNPTALFNNFKASDNIKGAQKLTTTADQVTLINGSNILRF